MKTNLLRLPVSGDIVLSSLQCPVYYSLHRVGESPTVGTLYPSTERAEMTRARSLNPERFTVTPTRYAVFYVPSGYDADGDLLADVLQDPDEVPCDSGVMDLEESPAPDGPATQWAPNKPERYRVAFAQ